MNTSAHLTSRSTTGRAPGDFRSSAMPRLLRFMRCQGYASFDTGCGGMWFAMRHRSPAGGSTLITSAPKSDKITAALGPVMKLARSTTFKSEKILSLTIVCLLNYGMRGSSSPAMKQRCALFNEGEGAFLLVLGCGAQAEIRSLEQLALALARLQALVCGLERELHRDRGVGGDLPQDRLGAGNQFGGRH